MIKLKLILIALISFVFLPLTYAAQNSGLNLNGIWEGGSGINYRLHHNLISNKVEIYRFEPWPQVEEEAGRLVFRGVLHGISIKGQLLIFKLMEKYVPGKGNACGRYHGDTVDAEFKVMRNGEHLLGHWFKSNRDASCKQVGGAIKTSHFITLKTRLLSEKDYMLTQERRVRDAESLMRNLGINEVSAVQQQLIKDYNTEFGTLCVPISLFSAYCNTSGLQKDKLIRNFYRFSNPIASSRRLKSTGLDSPSTKYFISELHGQSPLSYDLDTTGLADIIGDALDKDGVAFIRSAVYHLWDIETNNAPHPRDENGEEYKNGYHQVRVVAVRRDKIERVTELAIADINLLSPGSGKNSGVAWVKAEKIKSFHLNPLKELGEEVFVLPRKPKSINWDGC